MIMNKNIIKFDKTASILYAVIVSINKKRNGNLHLRIYLCVRLLNIGVL